MQLLRTFDILEKFYISSLFTKLILGLCLISSHPSLADSPSAQKSNLNVEKICLHRHPPYPQQKHYAWIDSLLATLTWSGKSGFSRADLDLFAMQDIRAKEYYYMEIATRVEHERPSLELLFKKTKNRLLDVVEEEIRNTENLSDQFIFTSKFQIIQKITNVKLVFFEEFVANDVSEMNYYFTGWGKRGNYLEQACRKDGLLLSAFYFEPESSVVICPGTEIQIFEKDIHLEALAFLLAHEISHSFDAKVFPQLYEKIQDFQSVPPLFWPETSADYWASRSISDLAFDKIIDQLKFFCDLPEDTSGFAKYPKGIQRIQFALDQILQTNDQ